MRVDRSGLGRAPYRTVTLVFLFCWTGQEVGFGYLRLPIGGDNRYSHFFRVAGAVVHGAMCES